MKKFCDLILHDDSPIDIMHNYAGGLNISRWQNGKWTDSAVVESGNDYWEFALRNGVAIPHNIAHRIGQPVTHMMVSGWELFGYRGTHDDVILYSLKHDLRILQDD
jgi:hypothetical protein